MSTDENEKAPEAPEPRAEIGRPPKHEKRNHHLKLRVTKSEREAIEQKRADLGAKTMMDVLREGLRKLGIFMVA